MMPVYTAIALHLNLPSKNDIISTIVSQIILIFEQNNFSYFTHANCILQELINGVKMHYVPDTKEAILVIGKLYLKEENFQKIYMHHISDNFEILKNSGKARSLLYKSLAKILFLVNFLFYWYF